MRLRILTIAILTIIFSVSVANAKKAIVIKHQQELTNVFKNISQKPFMLCQYQQTKTIKRINRDLKSEGQMIFSREQGIAWQAKKPFESTIVLGNKGITQIDASGNKTTMMSSDNKVFENFANTIQSVFKGDFYEIRSKYQITFSEDDKKNWSIDLVPRDQTLNAIVPKITLKGNDQIKSFIINEGNGDKITYSFSKHSYTENLKPEQSNLFD